MPPPPKPWYIPTNTGTYYLNSCDTSGFAGVPNGTIKGYPSFQYARTGVGYIFLDYNAGFFRTYIQVKLLDSLIKGHYYYAEHFVNVPNPMKYACNNIGMLFANIAIYADTNISYAPVIPANPQIINYGNPIISDTLNWIKVSGIFKAMGGEQYLTLGNFKDFTHTNNIQIQSNGIPSAGYLIDDVSVIPLDSMQLKADAGRDTTITIGDSAFIGSYTNGIDTIQWLQNGVTVIDTIRPGFWVYPTSNTYYILTQTVNGYTSRDTVYVGVQALPVSMLNFECLMLNERQVKVSWQTATEINVSHFNVQRSIDGITFETIGKVKAKGASTYTSKDPLTTHDSRFTTLYYRLEIVDKNGAISYSEIRHLVLSDNNEISIYPNPTKDLVRINGKNILSVKVSDIVGRMLINQSFNNTVNPAISLKGLVAGVYYLTITTTDGKEKTLVLEKR